MPQQNCLLKMRKQNFATPTKNLFATIKDLAAKQNGSVKAIIKFPGGLKFYCWKKILFFHAE